MLRSNLNTINARIFNKTAIRIDDQALRDLYQQSLVTYEMAMQRAQNQDELKKLIYGREEEQAAR